MHPKPPDNRKHLQVKLRPELKTWLEQRAQEQERSQSYVLHKLVEEAYAASKQQAISSR